MNNTNGVAVAPNQPQENQLAVIITESGLEKSKAQVLLDKFTNYFEIAAEWEQKINGLNVTDINQKAKMKMAGEARKFLKAKRVDIEKTRKELKEQSLREGQTIDSIARILKNLIEPLEEKAGEIETYAERMEAKRKAELEAARLEELQKYDFQYNTGFDLGAMDETMYSNLLEGCKKAYNDRIEAERKAEEERIAREKAEAEERERIRKENERLKAEAEERERQIAAERAKAEAERKAIEEQARKEREEAEAKAAALRAEQERALQAEREAKAKIEAELKAKQQEEDRIRREQEEKIKTEEKARKEAERKARNAPDKEKLLALIASIEAIAMPDVKSEEAQAIIADVKTLLAKVVNHIQSKSSIL